MLFFIIIKKFASSLAGGVGNRTVSNTFFATPYSQNVGLFWHSFDGSFISIKKLFKLFGFKCDHCPAVMI